MSKQVDKDILQHKNNHWNKFLETHGKNLTSSTKLWKEIDKVRNKEFKEPIGEFLFNGQLQKTNLEKCEAFGIHLKTIFTDTNIPNFSETLEQKVEASINR